MNLADYFRSHNIKYEPVAFADADEEVVKAYDAGRCDVYTDDATGLYGERIKMAVPDDNVILPEITISKEPLAPAVRQGDDKWFQHHSLERLRHGAGGRARRDVEEC